MLFAKRYRPFLIAGPCSAETEEQVLETARDLAGMGIDLFRAGYGNPVPARGDLRATAPLRCPGCAG